MHSLLRDQSKLFINHLQEKNLSPNTIRSYSADIRSFFEVWDASPSRSFKQALSSYFLHNRSVKKNTMARKVACLRSFKIFLAQHQNIIIPAIDSIPFQRNVPIVISQKEISKVLAYDFESLRDKAILEVFYATGILTSEIVNIKISDLNLDAKQIVIHGRNNKERVVLFGSKAKRALAKYLKRERPIFISTQEPLFLNFENRGGIKVRTVNILFEKLREQLSTVRSLSPRVIRHSFAAHLLDAGVDLRSLQELLGHQDIKNTQEYEKVAGNGLRQLVDTIHPMSEMV